MPTDLTRSFHDDLRLRYKAVVMQQGRVTLDRDFNALQAIVDGQIAADALDEIGPCGTPDNGFAITVPDPASPGSVPSSYSAPEPWDFLINHGTMYVGGERVVLPPPGLNQPPWSYFHQPDWINPETPAAFSRASQSTPLNEYIVHHVYEQEVSAVEDPDLLDVALGGPDTTQRVRLMWRVIRIPTDATDCPTALAQAKADWVMHGFKFDPPTMRRLPQALLQVSFTATPAATTPCDPVSTGGYLGAYNQLIRLQLSESGGKPYLLWGYDDASFLYQVSAQPDGLTLNLTQVPVDAFHSPATNQVVEVLRTAAILTIEPDATLPTGSQTTVGYVAEATGYVTTVKFYSNTDNTVTLSNPTLPASYLSDKTPLFLRIWQGRQPINLSSQPITLTDPTTSTSPGIQVTITVPTDSPKGAALPMGAYWMIAVRPTTPQAVYPQRFLNTPQWPDGPRQWICPLAVIEWPQDDVSASHSYSNPVAKINECRQSFSNLVELSKRQEGGCCSVSVAPSDSPNLQAILDKAAIGGQTVTICFSAGTYSLAQPLRLSSQHSGLVLEACGGGVTLEASPNADMTAFLDGLLVLVLADNVTLKNLQFLAPSVPLQQALLALGIKDSFTAITSSPALLQNIIGIRIFQCSGVSIEGCSIQLSPQENFLTIGFGVYISGDCTGLSIRNCHFTSTTPPNPTWTLPAIEDARVAVEALVGSIPGHLFTGTFLAQAATLTPAASQPVSASSPVPAVSVTSAAAASVQELVALFGVFADTVTEFISSGGSRDQLLIRESLAAVLDTGRLSDNDFENLTLAVWSTAAFGTYQVQKNRVTSCVGGFWLEASDYTAPTDKTVSSLLSYVNTLVLDFKEINAGETLTGLLPLPTGMSIAEFGTLWRQQPTAPPLSMTLSNNNVDATFATANVNGGTAIRLLLNRPVISNQDTSSSLILDSNSVRGNPPYYYYIPIIMVVTGGPTAVTGNLITRPTSIFVTSLLIFPNAGFASVPQLAVTGNVFGGETNLSGVIRSDATQLGLAPPFNTWAPFNSNN